MSRSFQCFRWHFYPGTGAADEIGAEAGLGTTANLPISVGTPPAKQLQLFENQLRAFAEKMCPELILVSAGFDSHKDDPVGSLGLESDDFRALTRCLLDLANEYSGGRLVSVLEGGYNPQAVSESASIHLEELLGRD